MKLMNQSSFWYVMKNISFCENCSDKILFANKLNVANNIPVNGSDYKSFDQCSGVISLMSHS